MTHQELLGRWLGRKALLTASRIGAPDVVALAEASLARLDKADAEWRRANDVLMYEEEDEEARSAFRYVEMACVEDQEAA